MAGIIHGDGDKGVPREAPPTDGKTLLVLGSPGSPYTLKVRAAFTYQRKSFRNIVRGGPDDKGFNRPPGPPLLPNVILPGGKAVGDSTFVLRDLDTPERSLYPPHPGMRFLCDLVEDFADEWGTKCMFHYRWVCDEDARKAAAVLPNFAVSVKNDKMQNSVARLVGQRQVGRLGIVGSNPQSAKIIESSYAQLLTVLKEHLYKAKFMFGDRPSAADFALFGQLSQLVLFDPTPAKMAADTAPNLVAWIWNMMDLSGLSVFPEDWHDTTPTLRPLFTLMGSTYAPLLLGQHEARIANRKTAVIRTPNGVWEQPAFKYQAKCLTELRRSYAALSPESKAFVDSALEGTGTDTLFTQNGKLFHQRLRMAVVDEGNPMQAASLIAASCTYVPLSGDEAIELENNVRQTASEVQEQPAKSKKTDVCRHWARGFCNRGVTCGFAHTGPTQSERNGDRLDENGEPYVVVKSNVPCKDFSSGKCNRGDRCKFAHVGTGPKKVTPSCRDWMAGTCNRGDLCKYKHDNIPNTASREGSSMQTTPISLPATPPFMEVGPRVVSHMVLAPSFQVATQLPILVGTPQSTPSEPPLWLVDSPQTLVLPQDAALNGSFQKGDAQLLLAEQNANRLRAQATAAELQLATLKSGHTQLVHVIGTDSPVSIDSHPTTFASDGTPQSTTLESLYGQSRVTLMTHQPYA